MGRLKGIGFHHDNISMLAKPFWPRMSQFWFFIYRLILTVYITVWHGLEFYTTLQGLTFGQYFIFVTHWTFIMFHIYLIYSLVLSFLIWRNYDRFDIEQPSYPDDQNGNIDSEVVFRHSKATSINFSIYWLIFDIASAGSLLVCVLFWAFVADAYIKQLKPGPLAMATSVHVHLISALIMIVEVFVTNIPIKPLHGVYPFLYAVIYGIFNAVYTLSGGTGINGAPYIYFLTDFVHKPGEAVVFQVLMIFIAVPLAWLVLFGFYRLKFFIYKKMYGESL